MRPLVAGVGFLLALARAPLADAVRRANVAAAFAVTRLAPATSPTAAEIYGVLVGG